MRVCRDFSMYKFAYGFLMDFGSWSYRCVLLKVGMYELDPQDDDHNYEN